MHFGTEHKLMSIYGYPATAEHVSIHDDFVAKVVAVREAFLKGEAELTLDVVIFVRDWLAKHIQEADRELCEYFLTTMETNTKSSIKTKSLFGLFNEELLFGFITELRKPFKSKIANIVIFMYITLTQFSNIYTWADHQMTMEGSYAHIVASILSFFQTFCVKYLGHEWSILMLLFFALLQISVLFLFVIGYSAHKKGFSFFFFESFQL